MNKKIIVLFLIFFCGCDEKKITVLQVTNENGDQLHWYVHSGITRISQSYVEFISGTSTPVILLKSPYLCDINFKGNDSIWIQCYRSDYKLVKEIEGYSISIDTSGSYRNGAELRINNDSFEFYRND